MVHAHFSVSGMSMHGKEFPHGPLFLAPLGRNSDGRDSEKPLGNGAGGAVWGACPSV